MKPTIKLRVALWVMAALTAGLLAGVAAIYVMDRANSNAAGCDNALKVASSLDSLRLGDMAGFQPAQRALDLTALKFTKGNAAEGAQDVTLGALQGKVLLVNFWATWCVPCRSEMPALDALAGEKSNADFAVVAINLDQGGGDKPQKFYRDTGIAHLKQYADKTMGVFGAIRTLGLAVGLPTTLLVDRKGCLIGNLMGPANWNGPAARALIERSMASMPKT